jgi:hypothetical protein
MNLKKLDELASDVLDTRFDHIKDAILLCYESSREEFEWENFAFLYTIIGIRKPSDKNDMAKIYPFILEKLGVRNTSRDETYESNKVVEILETLLHIYGISEIDPFVISHNGQTLPITAIFEWMVTAENDRFLAWKKFPSNVDSLQVSKLSKEVRDKHQMLIEQGIEYFTINNMNRIQTDFYAWLEQKKSGIKSGPCFVNEFDQKIDGVSKIMKPKQEVIANLSENGRNAGINSSNSARLKAKSINANLAISQSRLASPIPNSSLEAHLYPHHSSNENSDLHQQNHTESNTQSNFSNFHSTNNINNNSNSSINTNNLANRSHRIFPNSSSPSNLQQLCASEQHSNNEQFSIYDNFLCMTDDESEESINQNNSESNATTTTGSSNNSSSSDVISKTLNTNDDANQNESIPATTLTGSSNNSSSSDVISINLNTNDDANQNESISATTLTISSNNSSLSDVISKTLNTNGDANQNDLSKINSYKFSRFCLTDDNFKNLEFSGKTKDAWIHSETIVAYLEIQNKSAFVLDYYQTCKLFSGQSFILGVDLNFFDMICGPVLVNSNHWCGIFVDLKTLNFVYIDPYGNKDDADKKALDHWKSFASSHKLTRDWNLIEYDFARQEVNDTYNCGVYTI